MTTGSVLQVSKGAVPQEHAAATQVKHPGNRRHNRSAAEKRGSELNEQEMGSLAISCFLRRPSSTYAGDTGKAVGRFLPRSCGALLLECVSRMYGIKNRNLVECD